MLSESDGRCCPIRQHLSHLWQCHCRKFLISLFLLSFISVVGLHSLPSFVLRDALLVRPVVSFVNWTGLGQYWAIFVWNAPWFTYHVEAEIVFADGSQKIWVFPSAHQMSRVERLLKGRQLSWSWHVVAYPSAWPDTARFVARLHADDPKNPPQRVTLIQRCFTIPQVTSPKAQGIPKEYQHDQRTVLFVYEVKKEDL